MYTRQHAIQRARFLKFDLIFGNKAVVHRRLRCRFCHLSSYFKRPKNIPVRPLACSGITANASQTQGCVCTALQLGGDVEQPRFMSK